MPSITKANCSHPLLKTEIIQPEHGLCPEVARRFGHSEIPVQVVRNVSWHINMKQFACVLLLFLVAGTSFARNFNSIRKLRSSGYNGYQINSDGTKVCGGSYTSCQENPDGDLCLRQLVRAVS